MLWPIQIPDHAIRSKKSTCKFPSYINDCLRPYIDDFAVCYLEDILIYLTNQKEHEEHVPHVLQWLREFCLYCKGEKCQFQVSEVGFLEFVITPDGVGRNQTESPLSRTSRHRDQLEMSRYCSDSWTSTQDLSGNMPRWPFHWWNYQRN